MCESWWGDSRVNLLAVKHHDLSSIMGAQCRKQSSDSSKLFSALTDRGTFVSKVQGVSPCSPYLAHNTLSQRAPHSQTAA